MPSPSVVPSQTKLSAESMRANGNPNSEKYYFQSSVHTTCVEFTSKEEEFRSYHMSITLRRSTSSKPSSFIIAVAI